MEKLKHLLHGNDDAHHGRSSGEKDREVNDSHHTLGGSHTDHPSDHQSGLATQTDKHFSHNHNANATGADRTAERSTLDDVQGGRIGHGSTASSGSTFAHDPTHAAGAATTTAPLTPRSTTTSATTAHAAPTGAALGSSSTPAYTGAAAGVSGDAFSTPAVATAQGAHNAAMGAKHDEPDIHSELKRSPAGNAKHTTMMGALLDPTNAEGNTPLQPWTGGLLSSVTGSTSSTTSSTTGTTGATGTHGTTGSTSHRGL